MSHRTPLPAATTSEQRSPNRRALLTTAAWAAPVAAMSAAAPAVAASCEGDEVTVESRVPASQTSTSTAGPATSVSHTIPAGVSSVTFEVLGGGGGQGAYSQLSAGRGGGDGALITGEMAVEPGQVLTLIAANGGMGSDVLNQAIVTGGGGFGNGGNTATRTGNANVDSLTGGSGGGGSAILIEGDAAVVAGGGGGVGAVLARPSTGWTITGGKGGNAEVAGTGVNIARSGLATETAQGGGAAQGSTPGQPGGSNGSNGTVENGWRRVIGTAGTAPGTAGGNGGIGGTGPGFQINTERFLQILGPGGGGGYAGGAGGTTLSRVNDPSDYQHAVTGGGGGGSNFVDAQLVTDPAIGLGDNGADDGLRHPGYVIIRYQAPC